MNKQAFCDGYMHKEAGSAWRKWIEKAVRRGDKEGAVLRSLSSIADGKTGRLPLWMKIYDEDWNTVRKAMKGPESVSDTKLIEALKRGTSKEKITKGIGSKGRKGARKQVVENARESRLGTYTTWDKAVGTDPNSFVNITHSGTVPYIKSFLNKGTKGYPLEAGGRGLQIHPTKVGKDLPMERALYYGRVAEETTGLPAGLLRGRIKAKYLRSSNLGYEAGLTSENIKHLKDIEISNI